jgi:hypothetical protein
MSLSESMKCDRADCLTNFIERLIERYLSRAYLSRASYCLQIARTRSGYRASDVSTRLLNTRYDEGRQTVI